MPRKLQLEKHHFSYFGIIIITSFIATLFCYLAWYKQPQEEMASGPKDKSYIFESQSNFSNSEFYAESLARLQAEKADFITVDLSNMKLTTYKNGEVFFSVPVKAKGKEGSWWETPVGLYKVESKEKDHFSSIGKVHQPWSMVFQGNFFIHGWPYYPDGTPVASTFTGGCVRLANDDAEKVYEFGKVGMPILVSEKNFQKDNYDYSRNLGISASTYLVADLKNNFVFMDKNMGGVVPIASITKLMTALVTTEYIDLSKKIKIGSDDIIFTSIPRFRSGDIYPAYELLYPLLMESSNEAAMAISSYLGNQRFVSIMNTKAKALGMDNTKFADSFGGSAENVSTTEDLFLLAKYLYNNRSFVWRMTAGELDSNSYYSSTIKDYKNLNDFYELPEFVGGKVGETTLAKETMIAVFEFEDYGGNKRPVMIAIMGSENRRADIQKIINYLKLEYFK